MASIIGIRYKNVFDDLEEVWIIITPLSCSSVLMVLHEDFDVRRGIKLGHGQRTSGRIDGWGWLIPKDEDGIEYDDSYFVRHGVDNHIFEITTITPFAVPLTINHIVHIVYGDNIAGSFIAAFADSLDKALRKE